MSFNLYQTRLVFHSSPGTLSSITANKLAFLYCLRKNEISNFFQRGMYAINYWVNFSLLDIFEVSVPKYITEVVDHHIHLFMQKFVTWITSHQNLIFHKERHNILSNCLDCVVLQPNGEICYKTSAKNLLASDRLNPAEKYAVACVYCFQEDIKRLWPLVSDSDPAMSEYFTQPLKYPAVNYWTNVNKNIPANLMEFARDNHLWHSANLFEYRWSSANRPEIEVLPNIDFKKEMSAEAIASLFSKLDIQHQNQFLENNFIDLITVLARNDEPSFYTLQLWKHVQNNVTSAQFSSIIQFLWLEAFDRYRNIFSTARSYMPVLLDEIWISAPEHLREIALNDRNLILWFFYRLQLTYEMKTPYSRDIRFYRRIFRDIDAELRNTVWLQNWQKFVCLAKPSDLNDLLKLCLGSTDRVEEFIKNKMKSFKLLKRELCIFFKTGKFQELTEYLRFFCTDEKSVRKKQRKIFKAVVIDRYSDEDCSGFATRFYSRSKGCAPLNEFIDNAFSCEDSTQQFKNEFLRFYFGIRIYEWNSSLLDEVINLAETFFSSEKQRLTEAKKMIYEFFHSLRKRERNPVEYKTNLEGIQKWKAFFKWCEPEDNLLVWFKETHQQGVNSLYWKIYILDASDIYYMDGRKVIGE